MRPARHVLFVQYGVHRRRAYFPIVYVWRVVLQKTRPAPLCRSARHASTPTGAPRGSAKSRQRGRAAGGGARADAIGSARGRGGGSALGVTAQASGWHTSRAARQADGLHHTNSFSVLCPDGLLPNSVVHCECFSRDIGSESGDAPGDPPAVALPEEADWPQNEAVIVHPDLDRDALNAALRLASSCSFTMISR